MRRFLFAVTWLSAVPLAAQQPERWFATWAPSVVATPRVPADTVDPFAGYANRTVRQIVHTSVGGNHIRVRLSNEYGDGSIVIGAVHIAIRDTGASIRAGTDRRITFGGQPSITLGSTAVVTSDPIEMTVPALVDLSISIWIADSGRVSTWHALGLQTNYVSSPGDFTSAISFPEETRMTGPLANLRIQPWILIAGVDVASSSATGTIVAFGNSITDGYGSTADSNARWPDVLARRLLESTEAPKAVINAGISGNGVLSQIAGPSALVRFDRDVLAQPGVTHVIVLEGINDLGRGSSPRNPHDSVSAAAIIRGYQQLIEQAHERGVVIFGATLTPMGNMGRPNTAGANAKRKAINEWIRSSGGFDGVIDFDAVTRDPANPDAFLPAYDSGDHLHPSDAGYRAMGEAIDLTMFRRTYQSGTRGTAQGVPPVPQPVRRWRRGELPRRS